MSDSFTCPYCQKIFALHFETYSHFLINKEGHLPMKADASTVRIEYFICPSCGKYLCLQQVWARTQTSPNGKFFLYPPASNILNMFLFKFAKTIKKHILSLN